MDFANAVCTPKAPRCGICPLANACRANAIDMAKQLPFKAPKRQKPGRRGIVFVAINQNGEAFLERRPIEGYLAVWWLFHRWLDTNRFVRC